MGAEAPAGQGARSAHTNDTSASKVLISWPYPMPFSMRLVAERPGIGHTRADLAREPVRFWPVYSYLIIYRPETNPLEVSIGY